MKNIISKSIAAGVMASFLLFLVFVIAVRLLSGGWQQIPLQLQETGAYIVILILGFGVQISMWYHIRRTHVAHRKTHGVTAVSGASSTTGMLACCTHYLANIIPFLGFSGIAGLITQYQSEILTASIGINFLGMAYLYSLIRKHKKESIKHLHCHS